MAGQYSTAQHSNGERPTSLGQDSAADVSNGLVRAGHYITVQDSTWKGRTLQHKTAQVRARVGV
jgi:hypothetical protein